MTLSPVDRSADFGLISRPLHNPSPQLKCSQCKITELNWMGLEFRSEPNCNELQRNPSESELQLKARRIAIKHLIRKI